MYDHRAHGVRLAAGMILTRPCACGCSEILEKRPKVSIEKWNKRFYKNITHESRHKKKLEEAKGRKCLCGCGVALKFRPKEKLGDFMVRKYNSAACSMKSPLRKEFRKKVHMSFSTWSDLTPHLNQYLPYP